MKNIFTKLALLSSSIVLASSAMADVTASATATWDATAVKDTTSVLVVTPLKSLNFQYAEGLEAFNTQTGAFDITIQGQSGATDFELTSKLISNTLTRGSDASTLDVGVAWNGTKLDKTTPTTLINTTNGTTAGLDALAQSSKYSVIEKNTNKPVRSSAQGNFVFSIDGATSNGADNVEFSDLADGMWNGEVSVQFTALWTVPEQES
ncbi:MULTISPECIES: common pilus major fimbrillin subunit EcpA [unclassified Acinetobacter]|uniref:common pilus major fimbrillin subunit EcpA n=1 Tax=unclassified Acinetobacter TaxID=196816 RepID=UPI00293451D0|nr:MULTISPECIES: common pilus major fimbrillin subunit EcpA [unclassified Acinetobacter]WOE32315.1 common pilus major fimbrillin subunit EcpA [Acinetobacter sp. SAAs470]WOE37786.1 common pilus major fimbrillin subunit EcpA [Acinetobacter sp. SAAs474]